MIINEAIETLRYEIDEECHCDYIADEIRVLISAYENLITQEEKAHQYCKNVCEPKYKAEIERLQKNLEEAHLDIKEQRAGIESLEAENKLLIDRNCELAEKGEKAVINFVKSQNQIKAEAYKEFAERLKENKCSYDLPDYHSFDAVDIEEIDNLLKELVGEDK